MVGQYIRNGLLEEFQQSLIQTLFSLPDFCALNYYVQVMIYDDDDDDDWVVGNPLI
jgi:hypothetical protein